MTSPVTELARALGKKPDAVRAQLRYYNIKVRGQTLKQLMQAMRKHDLIPEGVLELDGVLPPGLRPNGNGSGNGTGAAHEPTAEANLALRLHGIRERLERIEPLALVNVRSGTNGPWEAYFLNLLRYARTGDELDIQNLVRELTRPKND